MFVRDVSAMSEVSLSSNTIVGAGHKFVQSKVAVQLRVQDVDMPQHINVKRWRYLDADCLSSNDSDQVLYIITFRCTKASFETFGIISLTKRLERTSSAVCGYHVFDGVIRTW